MTPGVSLGEMPTDIRAATQLGGIYDVPGEFTACMYGAPMAWTTRFEGLWIVWEGESFETARSGNWGYVGAQVDGQPQMITDRGITVGSSVADLMAAHPDAQTSGDDTLFVPGMRFVFRDGVVTWMGNIDCGD